MVVRADSSGVIAGLERAEAETGKFLDRRGRVAIVDSAVASREVRGGQDACGAEGGAGRDARRPRAIPLRSGGASGEGLEG